VLETLFQGVKWSVHEADDWSPSSAEVKNRRGFAFIRPYICLHGVMLN
jgi:hypothetical protein